MPVHGKTKIGGRFGCIKFWGLIALTQKCSGILACRQAEKLAVFGVFVGGLLLGYLCVSADH